ELRFVDMYYSASGTGFDAAYKVLIDDRIDLARTPFDIEAHFFQLEFDERRNLTLADFRGGKKLLVATGYMPVLFVNALGHKISPGQKSSQETASSSTAYPPIGACIRCGRIATDCEKRLQGRRFALTP